MGGQRPGPYDRPVMSGPRGAFFGPGSGSGRGGGLMDTVRSGGGYGGSSGGGEKSLRLQKSHPQFGFDISRAK